MNELIPALQRLIGMDSTTQAGAADCLRWVLALAQSMGFRTENMDDIVGWVEYGDQPELLCVLGHLDVVPAGAGWTKEPFGGALIDGRLYGRGATDDKGPILAALFALNKIKCEGVRLRRRVRILFGTQEETGGDDLHYYRAHGGELPTLGFTPDGEFPVIQGEKGFLIEEYACNVSGVRCLWGGTAANIVPDSAYAVLDDGTRLECTGVAAHGAEPWNGINAIGRLMEQLDALSLAPDLQAAVHFLHTRIGMETDGASLGIAMEDSLSGPLSFNLGMLRCDGSSLRVTVNYRYPVTRSVDDCVPQVRAAFEAAGFTRVSGVHEAKLFMAEDSFLVRRLLEVYSGYTGTTARAKCIGGGTYAKFLPNTVAFGPIFPGDEVTEHRPDEYISLRRLEQNYELLRLAILALAEELPPDAR